MSRKSILSIVLFISTFLLILMPLTAQEEAGEIIIISERVGEIIDQQERDKYKLFQEVKGFQSAVFLKFPDNRCILKIIYKDEQMDELKVDRVEQSEESINKIRDSIRKIQTPQEVFQFSLFDQFAKQFYYAIS